MLGYLGQFSDQWRNLRDLIPLMFTKRKAPASASESIAITYLQSFPQVRLDEDNASTTSGYGYTFSWSFFIHLPIWSDLVTPCLPTHIWSSWHSSCLHPGHRKPQLEEQQHCVPDEPEDDAPQGRASQPSPWTFFPTTLQHEVACDRLLFTLLGYTD